MIKSFDKIIGLIRGRGKKRINNPIITDVRSYRCYEGNKSCKF